MIDALLLSFRIGSGLLSITLFAQRLNQDNKDGVWDSKLHRLARLRGFSCHPVGSSTTSFFSWPIIKVEATTNPVSDACVACPFTRTLATKRHIHLVVMHMATSSSVYSSWKRHILDCCTDFVARFKSSHKHDSSAAGPLSSCKVRPSPIKPKYAST